VFLESDVHRALAVGRAKETEWPIDACSRANVEGHDGEGRDANGAQVCPLVSVVLGYVGEIGERASASRLKE
jgi:hypothetical protein